MEEAPHTLQDVVMASRLAQLVAKELLLSLGGMLSRTVSLKQGPWSCDGARTAGTRASCD